MKDEGYSLAELDGLKIRVYRIGLSLAIVVLSILVWQMGYTGPLNPEEGVVLPAALGFCVLSLALLERYRARFLPWFERMVYALVFLYHWTHYWNGLRVALRDQHMIDFDRFLIWLPVVYAVAFMYFPSRRAVQVSALFLAGIVLPGAWYLRQAQGQAYYPIDFALLLSLSASGVIFTILFYTLAVLRERYAAALSLAQALRSQAETDHLTHIYSRAKIFDLFEQQVRLAQATGRPFSIIVADMDGLKRINDTRGHAAGDAALQRVAAAIRSAIRRGDAVGRIGGDEFLVLCPGADADAAAGVCARIEQAVAGQAVEDSPLSVSYDYATWQPGDSLSSLFRRADEGMYRHKHQRKAGVGG